MPGEERWGGVPARPIKLDDHSARHEDGGADEISLAGLSGTPADLTTHIAASDPHTGYRLESADHTHQTTGAQAGQLDHGLALTGLTDDDHTQYILKTLYDAYSILMATTNDTPIALTVAEQTLIGRITGGIIAALTAAQVRTLLNLEEGTHIADPSGGVVVDTEARATINAILVRLEEKDINATV